MYGITSNGIFSKSFLCRTHLNLICNQYNFKLAALSRDFCAAFETDTNLSKANRIFIEWNPFNPLLNKLKLDFISILFYWHNLKLAAFAVDLPRQVSNLNSIAATPQVISAVVFRVHWLSSDNTQNVFPLGASLTMHLMFLPALNVWVSSWSQFCLS